jgi:hypothetical protein
MASLRPSAPLAASKMLAAAPRLRLRCSPCQKTPMTRRQHTTYSADTPLARIVGENLRPATAIIIVMLLVIIAVAGIVQLVQILNT